MSHQAPDLEDIAGHVVKLSEELGATGAECSVSEGDEFEATVRLGQVETVKESGSRAAGVRVLFGHRPGSSYTSDLTSEGLRAMVQQAVESARVTTEDPHAGLPSREELGSADEDLRLYSEDIAALEASRKIDMARDAERAALDFDPRINNSDGASFTSNLGRHAFANSNGFSGSYRTSSCSLHAVPVASDGDRMERDYWSSIARRLDALEVPADIGRKAAERVLRRLNPRKIQTTTAAVVFEPRVARSLVSHIFEAVNGDSIYRKASFLYDKLGEPVASPLVTVVDDATLPGLFGSAPFDDEGVPSRRTGVVEDGVLRSYLLNTYTARKLGMKTTGSASRGITGNAGVGHGNLYFRNGTMAPEEVIRKAGRGLFVTELLGFGVNIVTGDYSRGATGLWIENGELAYAVSEVTIAGNLSDMLRGVEAAGNDLEFRGSVASPTILIREMTISGR